MVLRMHVASRRVFDFLSPVDNKTDFKNAGLPKHSSTRCMLVARRATATEMSLDLQHNGAKDERFFLSFAQFHHLYDGGAAAI